MEMTQATNKMTVTGFARRMTDEQVALHCALWPAARLEFHIKLTSDIIMECPTADLALCCRHLAIFAHELARRC
jgi:hypothetical protein